MRISSAILAAGLLVGFAGTASAQTDGWYYGAEAGANFVPKLAFATPVNSWTQQQDTGYAVMGQVGYGFGPWRAEGEIGWRSNDINSFANGSGNLNPGGSLGGVSFMFNLLHDFKTNSNWTPYIGAGIGDIHLSADQITASGLKVTNDVNDQFAYQAIAGIAYRLTDAMSIRADYHYLRSSTASFTLNPAYDSGFATSPYSAHTIMVGFVVRFPAAAAPAPVPAMAAPPPPPPPAPAPAPAPKPVQAAPIAKNFMVFFDFDKSDLTPEAQAIINQAAAAAQKNHSTTIALTGYTDLSGPVEYNLKLSVRRGESVKKMLVQLGIPAGEISVVGKGKSDPLVPTKDGVREPQNRRVTIVLE
jgi:outer membrane protein OmpA-like peptidoglycan-associated protein